MVYYDLRIEKQQIFGADKIAVAANANETVSFRFFFDAGWRIFDAKAAIFKTAENKFYIMEIKSSSVIVPWEVLTIDRDFELSVIGYDGATVLTAGKVDIHVVSSLLPEEYKTFSPTETIFDRFKQESLNDAFKKYRDEIESLKRSYEKKIVEMGVLISEADEKTKNMEKSKNDEIEKINQNHAAEVSSLNNEISNINATLAATKIKADKWDLVDAAMEDKTRSNFALWTGGTKEYKLPFFNTKNMSYLSGGNFDGNVTELGLDLTSATTLLQVFSQKASLRKIELRNTDNIKTICNAFSNSTMLREVILGDLTSCANAKDAFYGDTSLEKITFGKNKNIDDFSGMFGNCIALREINGVLDTTIARNVTKMFENCSSLEKVTFKDKSIYTDLSLEWCKQLSKESMENIIFHAIEKNGDRFLALSKYAFYNNFPSADDREDIIDFMTQKNWELKLI